MTVTVEHIKHILTSEKESIRSDFGIEHLSLYGSYAKGVQNADSDIDIAYDLSATASMSLRKLQRLEQKIRDLLHIEKVELVNSRYMNPVIAEEIKTYVISIF